MKIQSFLKKKGPTKCPGMFTKELAAVMQQEGRVQMKDKRTLNHLRRGNERSSFMRTKAKDNSL